MKRTVLYVISAILGIMAGILIHCSFMVVSAEGVFMLPTIEPGQKVVVCLLDKDVEKGDVVAYKPPYYTLEGEGNIVFRRVEGIIEHEGSAKNLMNHDAVLLTCDTNMTQEHNVMISKEDVLGTVLLWDQLLERFLG